MKISQLIVSLLVLLAGGTLVYFSADQQKAMNIVTYAHGAGTQVAPADATGLRALNRDLEGEYARVSGERAEAMKATESARVEMNDQKAKNDDAQSALEAKQAEKKKLEADLAKQKSITKEAGWIAQSKNEAHGLSELETIIEDCSAEVPDYDAAVEKIGEVYKAQGEEKETLDKNLTKATEAKDAATAELTKQKAELARLTEVNERFFRSYMKNGVEFTVTGVDTGWRYVTFNAGKDSELVKGDTLLIHRGDTVITLVRITKIEDGSVTAEIDEKFTTPGLHPAAGDMVVREKPLSN